MDGLLSKFILIKKSGREFDRQLLAGDAINNARDRGRSTIGATMYTTLFPCADCARAIIAAGIKRLVAPYSTPSTKADAKWLQHFEHSQRMLYRARVELQTYSVLELGLPYPPSSPSVSLSSSRSTRSAVS